MEDSDGWAKWSPLLLGLAVATAIMVLFGVAVFVLMST